MEAAAAVAVAAAAAAHQNQQHHKRERQDSDLDQKQNQSLNGHDGYTQGDSLHADQIAAAEAVESVRKLQEGDDTFADDSMQYVQTDVNEQTGERQSSASRPTAYHSKRRKVNTCIPCKVSTKGCSRLALY